MLSLSIKALIISWLTCFGIAYELMGVPLKMVLATGAFFSAFILITYLGGLFFSWLYMKTQRADYRSLEETRWRWTTMRMEKGRPAQVTDWQGDASYSWFEWNDVAKIKDKQKWNDKNKVLS